MCKKESYVVNAAIVMAIAVMMFFPMMGTAGSLDPSAVPEPTMKTLDQIPPTWDQKLPASTRFIVLTNWGDAAVLDRETGLVWEQSPSTSTFAWEDAQNHCNTLTTGGRLGWRLPTIQELASLVNPGVSPGPTLPAGHPFINVQSTGYWSATTLASSTTHAWLVSFNNGSVFTNDVWIKSSAAFIWCVRGGHGVDPQ